jgi:hypothetical protein
MSKRRTETATGIPVPVPSNAPGYETTALHDISPAADRARQLRIIELLEQIAAKVGQGKQLENK